MPGYLAFDTDITDKPRCSIFRNNGVICIISEPKSSPRGGLVLFCETSLDGLGLLFEARLLEKGEHILLVSLYSRLVERIHSESVSADATCELEEIEQVAEGLLIDPLDGNLELWNTAVNVGKLCSELSHRVAVFNVLSCKVIQLVKILLVAADHYAAVAVLDVHNGLEHDSRAVLNKLAK